MVKELLYKWFGLEPFPCPSCEILRNELNNSHRERRELLAKLLDKDKSDLSPATPQTELRPFKPQFTPWRVRQQMLEAEDRKQAQLMRDKKDEIDSLEKELGIPSAGT